MSFAVTAAVGIGVASAGVNYASQASAANTQNAYRRRLGISQNKQFQENATAVIKDIGSQIDQLAQRDIQQAAATRQELDGIIRNARQTQGSFRAQVGAAGVQGP
jgi:predicted nucleotide-binding protein